MTVQSTPRLRTIKGIPYASSLDIAERFEVPHKNVLRAIDDCVRRLKSEPSTAEFAASEFVESTYQNAQNHTNRMWLLTEEGFAMSVFLFKTPKARFWQTRYIMAFKAMKQELFERELDKIRLRHADQQLLADGMIREFMTVTEAAYWLRRKTKLDITAPKLTRMLRNGRIEGKFIPLKSIVYSDSMRSWLRSLGVLVAPEEFGGESHASN